jgi:CRISPR-associated endonuclease Cas1
LVIEDLSDKEKSKILTKMPFQKILALIIVGKATITTPLIEKCLQFGVAITAVKQNFRPIFMYSIAAQANYLLRKKQYEYSKENIKIPKILVTNKIQNSIKLLKNTRLKSESVQNAKEKCKELLEQVKNAENYDQIMGFEGLAAKVYFAAYFENNDWKGRKPRTKIDPINSTLDIGYTILFNFVEIFVSFFGFDTYCGVYHRLWFKRKSLICDLIEPFRCIIDRKVRKAFNTNQCKASDFDCKKGEYILKLEKNKDYREMIFEELIVYKNDMFLYVQKYYRAFMQDKNEKDFPQFLI